MRHTVHIMLGNHAGTVLTDIKKYVLRYGSEEENIFFNAMLYREETDEAVFYTARPAEQDETQFVSGIENLYHISLEPFYTLPQTNRTEYLQACLRRSITGRSPSITRVTHLRSTSVSTYRYMRASTGNE